MKQRKVLGENQDETEINQRIVRKSINFINVTNTRSTYEYILKKIDDVRLKKQNT